MNPNYTQEDIDIQKEKVDKLRLLKEETEIQLNHEEIFLAEMYQFGPLQNVKY